MYRTILFCLVLTLLSTTMYSQKTNLSYYNKLQQVVGTEYLIATYEDYSKKWMTVTTNYLLFVNTSNGEKTSVELGKDAFVERIDQIIVDSLGINKVLVYVYTHYDDKRFMDMRDRPRYVLILSTDGKEKTRITEEGFYPGSWAVNNLTGAVVITGYYDLNKNGKHDDDDKNDILIYDLKTLKKI